MPFRLKPDLDFLRNLDKINKTNDIDNNLTKNINNYYFIIDNEY